MSSVVPPHAKTWHIQIDIGEHEGWTRATAHLETGSGTDLSGAGEAHLNPLDPDIPEIGDELAAARALSHLAHNLLDTAADDLSAALRHRVRLEE